jgi:hypothetical protein
MIDPDRLWRFQLLFGTAFLLYAIGWVGSYFTLRGVAGEWVGSLAGSILMALVICFAFGVIKTFFRQAALLFITNSAGYFLGGLLDYDPWEDWNDFVGRNLWVVSGCRFGIVLISCSGAAAQPSR